MKNVKLSIWWNEKTTFEKLLEVIQLLLSIVVIIVAILTLSNVWEAGFTLVFPPVFGVQSLINAYKDWNSKRKMAIFELCCGVFFAIVSIVNIILEIVLH